MILGHNSRIQIALVRFLIAGFLIFATLCAGVLLYNLTDARAERAPQSLETIHEQYHYYFTGASQNKISLTFDDGPVPTYTEEIAATLEKHHAPATFFFIGQNVLAHPSIAKDISDKGFKLGNHSMTHQWSVHESKERMARELNATNYLIKHVTGQDPLYYRPPFLLGIGTDPTISPYIPLRPDMQWATELGYIPVGIDVDSLDWAAGDAVSIAKTIVYQHDRGHIVLFHDEKLTASALDGILTYLENRGYTFVTLDDLLVPPTHVVLKHNLKTGDTNATTAGAVSELQWFLYAHGYLDPYELTGTYDVQTTEAVQRFQVLARVVNPLDLDPATYGVVNAETRTAIASFAPAASTDVQPQKSILDQAVDLMGTIAIYFAASIHMTLLVVTAFALTLLVTRLALISLLALRRATKRTRQGPHRALPPHVPVTVIIPAYNEAANIAGTIESVANSHYADLEIIIVNDGSTDDTAKIAAHTASGFPLRPIKIISVPNGGKARALMLGVHTASSDVIITMDGDSVFAPGTVTALARRFADPTVAAVAGKVYTASMTTLIDRMQALEYFIGQNIEKKLLDLVNAINIVPGPVGAWRKSDLLAAGGFSTDTLVEDQDMTTELLVRGRRVVYEPKAIAYAETPRTLRSFLRQRYRWIFGTIQCFWKHRRGGFGSIPGALVGNTASVGIFVTYINIFFYGILLPLAYPLIDSILVYGLVTGSASVLLGMVAAFTLFDMAYAMIGLYGEKQATGALIMVPFARVVYRQMLYLTAICCTVRALEGRHVAWGTINRTGQAQLLYETEIQVSAK